MVANFIQANILDTDSDLGQLNGIVDVVIANQFIHLFDWEPQVLVLKLVVQLSKPKTVLMAISVCRCLRGPPKDRGGICISTTTRVIESFGKECSWKRRVVGI